MFSFYTDTCLSAVMLATPTVVLVQHMPTSRLIPLLRKWRSFVHQFFIFPCFCRLHCIRPPRSMCSCRLQRGWRGFFVWNEWDWLLVLSVVGCSSWDLHTMCRSPAVPCHLQTSIELLCMTWGSTRRVFTPLWLHFCSILVRKESTIRVVFHHF